MATADQRDADPDIAWSLLTAGAPMRQGRSIGRTLYLQVDASPSNDDLCIGLVDSPRLAGYIAHCVNRRRSVNDLKDQPYDQDGE